MPATNTSSISTSELRRRHRKTSAIRPPATAAAASTHAARSVGVGGTVPVAGAMNSMSIRGPETDAEGLPFPAGCGSGGLVEAGGGVVVEFDGLHVRAFWINS